MAEIHEAQQPGDTQTRGGAPGPAEGAREGQRMVAAEISKAAADGRTSWQAAQQMADIADTLAWHARNDPVRQAIAGEYAARASRLPGSPLAQSPDREAC